MDIKECGVCHETLPASEFHKSSSNKGGLGWQCKKCRAEYGKEYNRKRADELKAHRESKKDEKRAYDQAYHAARRGEHLEAMQRNALMRRYGITQEDYDEMLAAQGGTCAICPATVGHAGKRLAVDHDHMTGRVRAILCDRCNQILGMAKDDPDLLRKCAEYLVS